MPKLTPNEIRFAIAYIDWKFRRRLEEPTGDEFRIGFLRAEEIARAIHQDFERSVVEKTLGLFPKSTA